MRSLSDLYVGQLRPAMLLLCGAVALLLLLAIVNSAHTFAARMHARQGRIALQLALGAPPGRLMAGLFGRSLLLSLLGAALGLAIAAASVDLLWRGLGDTLPEWMQIELATGPVLAILALAVLASALASALPMRRLAEVDPATCLQDGGQRSMGSPRERRQQRAMLAVQVALALVLVGVGAQFALDALRAHTHPSGFASESRLSFRVALPWAKYDSRTDATSRFYDQLGSELSALPGVQHAAWGERVPATDERAAAGSGAGVDLRLPDEPERPLPWRPRTNRVSEGYFEALGITLVAGRDFTPEDKLETPQVAIVSHELALRLWPDRDPIGAQLLLPEALEGAGETVTVIGIADDVRYDLSQAQTAPTLYRPVRQRPNANLYVVVSHQGPPPTDAQLRSAMAKVDPEQSLYELTSMAALRDRQLWQSSLLAQLLSALAVCAWILVAIGLAGLSRLWAVQRRRDMAVRAALGASASRLYRDSLGEVLRVLGWGIAIGLPLLNQCSGAAGLKAYWPKCATLCGLPSP